MTSSGTLEPISFNMTVTYFLNLTLLELFLSNKCSCRPLQISTLPYEIFICSGFHRPCDMISWSCMGFYQQTNILVTRPAPLNCLSPQVRTPQNIEAHPNYYAFYATAIFLFRYYFANKKIILLSVLVLLACYRGYLFRLYFKRALIAFVRDCEHILSFLVQAP